MNTSDESMRKNFSGYLAKAVKYTRTDYIKKHRNIVEVELLSESVERDAYKVEPSLYDAKQNFGILLEDERVFDAIKGLSPENKKILFLRTFYEMDFPTIAKQIGLPLKKVSSSYYNTIKKIRRELEK